MITKALKLEAKRRAIDILDMAGIRDTFMVRVKPYDAPTANPAGGHDDWISMYRYRSQFRCSTPIFWVNDALDECVKHSLGREPTRGEVIEELVICLLHEYGHVIYEFGVISGCGLKELIDSSWEDEEDWAEDFAKQMVGDEHLSRHEPEIYESVVRVFARECFKKVD